jgi:hypothetical protein
MNTLKNHYRVKHILFLLLLILLSSPAINVNAQNSDIQIAIEIIDASSPQAEDGIIQIEIKSNGSNFLYMLYDKEPWKGGEKMKPDAEAGKSYSFTDLRSGKYYVCVQNRDEVTKCTTVSIKPKK